MRREVDTIENTLKAQIDYKIRKWVHLDRSPPPAVLVIRYVFSRVFLAVALWRHFSSLFLLSGAGCVSFSPPSLTGGI